MLARAEIEVEFPEGEGDAYRYLERRSSSRERPNQGCQGEPLFSPDALRREHFSPCEKTTVCGWKGTASYYDVTAGDQTAAAAAWYYPDPLPKAEHIANHVAFGGPVEVRE